MLLHLMPLIFGLGAPELIVIVLVVLLLFGGRKIPELMRGLGRGVRSFREGVNGKDDADAATPAADKASRDDVKEATDDGGK